MARDAAIAQREQDYQLKVAAIEREVAKYLASKQEES
jgi:hypothetical protein